MANHLSIDRKATVLSLLTEGMSSRAIQRATGTNRETVLKLLVDAGTQARRLMAVLFTDLCCRSIQVDEIWTYVGKKQHRLTAEQLRRGDLGDQYVFVAIDADTKLVPVFYVGKRHDWTALAFLRILRKRVQQPFQLTTDGFSAYAQAMPLVFSNTISYGQMIKSYQSEPADLVRRYAPPRLRSIKRKVISGTPFHADISTSYIERQNLTMRTSMKRFTRLTCAFSRKLENLKAAVALHFFSYNFLKVHTTLKTTPAVAAGVADGIWTWEKLLTGSVSSQAA